MSSNTTAADYSLGYTDTELQRLDRQGAHLKPFTQRVLSAAGIKPGMRVLDIGSGSGDVSLLVAEMVGPEGSVVGIDQAEESIRASQCRAKAKGITNVEFFQANATDFAPTAGFDAVTGRLVLMYLSDPAATLNRLAGCVRPGAVIAFLDIIMLETPIGAGDQPLANACSGYIREAFRRNGCATDMGIQLGRVFHDAGLSWPEMVIEGVPIVGPNAARYQWLVATLRSLLPLMERTGVVQPGELDMDTIFDRLMDEANRTGPSLVPILFGGAWTTT